MTWYFIQMEDACENKVPHQSDVLVVDDELIRYRTIPPSWLTI